MTPTELYADVRLRITALVAGLSDQEAAVPVPGCPGWTVHDVVAHATGILADSLAGNLDGVASDPWTDAQVQARRTHPLAEVIGEWETLAAKFEPTLDDAPKGLSRTLLVDLTTHEHDIRGALGRPGGRGEAYEISRKSYAVGLAKTIEAKGMNGLALRAPDWSFDAGPEPQTTVTAPDSFELFRALSGRRSLRQVLDYEWQGDPAPYLPILNRFGPLPEADVIEG